MDFANVLVEKGDRKGDKDIPSTSSHYAQTI